ncbi:TetR/AcrR family transcriptional regulator [Phenylobacterium aquaticum]|uniref:TetR/AcrR family transcriptional regulator n=1 Tax=Phenylobacterium aquaticum TaxID=1763816 RepID=UPI0026E9AB0A|nr:TetR/AcrR family transcriptional regulator [Phenylobacterium aquaticum]
MDRARASRLSREDRREQILDSAKALILEGGLSQCTLEAVAIQAGISKALIYRHFSTVEDLLRALLSREYHPAAGDLKAAEANDFPERVRLGTERVFAYCNENRALVHMLLNDPGVARLLGADALPAPDSVHRVFAGHAAATYGLPPGLASLGAYLMLNAMVGSGDPVERMGLTSETAAAFWTTFSLAGWAAVAARYGQKA